MGKAPCCDKANVKKGPWSPEEDKKLKAFIEKNGTGGNWIALPQKAGLKRCGKSCRLRWLNYLRPNIKHGEFSPEEDRIICNLHANIGSRWSIIAAQLPGRTDNDIKNYWNTKLKKKLLGISQTLKKPNQVQQQLHLPSSLETQPSSLSNFHFHPFQVPQNTLNPCSTLLQPLLHHNLYNKDCGGNVLMFAGEQPCCSSSDGSSNQLSNGKEAESELGFESFCYGGLDEYHKLLMNQSNGENGVGLFVSGYGVKEELMRYNNGGVLFDVDASIGSRGNGTKSQERGLYYY